MKNKQFRQSLIDVQQNASQDNTSSLLTTMLYIRVRDTTGHFTRLSIIRNKRLKYDDKGVNIVSKYTQMGLQRCIDRVLLITEDLY